MKLCEENMIKKAIKKAINEFPELGHISNPYELIAIFLPPNMFSRKKNENLFQQVERVKNEIDSI